MQASSLHHKAKKEWEWQFSLVLLVFPIPLSYAFQHCPCSLSCLHLAAVVCTHPSLFSSLPWQLAFLFIDSPIFFLGNFDLHIVRLLRLHVFCLPQLTCLCSPAASHSSADLAFTVHFLVYSASPSLTLPSLRHCPLSLFLTAFQLFPLHDCLWLQTFPCSLLIRKEMCLPVSLIPCFSWASLILHSLLTIILFSISDLFCSFNQSCWLSCLLCQPLVCHCFLHFLWNHN